MKTIEKVNCKKCGETLLFVFHPAVKQLSGKCEKCGAFIKWIKKD